MGRRCIHDGEKSAEFNNAKLYTPDASGFILNNKRIETTKGYYGFHKLKVTYYYHVKQTRKVDFKQDWEVRYTNGEKQPIGTRWGSSVVETKTYLLGGYYIWPTGEPVAKERTYTRAEESTPTITIQKVAVQFAEIASVSQAESLIHGKYPDTDNYSSIDDYAKNTIDKKQFTAAVATALRKYTDGVLYGEDDWTKSTPVLADDEYMYSEPNAKTNFKPRGVGTTNFSPVTKTTITKKC